MTQSYLVALGSNRRGRHGAPADEVRAALVTIGAVDASPIVSSAPIGPSTRRFANAVARVDSDLAPPAFLERLKAIERQFGRRRGRRWGARVLDLDIVGWSGGVWTSPTLAVPHPGYRQRRFVLDPLLLVAPTWRDPLTQLTARHAHARLTRRRPLPNRDSAGAGP